MCVVSLYARASAGVILPDGMVSHLACSHINLLLDLKGRHYSLVGGRDNFMVFNGGHRQQRMTWKRTRKQNTNPFTVVAFNLNLCVSLSLHFRIDASQFFVFSLITSAHCLLQLNMPVEASMHVTEKKKKKCIFF